MRPFALALGASSARAAPANVVAPQRVDATPVPYPAGGHGEASVLLAVVVDVNGAVTDVTVRQGSPPFDDAAAAAVKEWHFVPATRDDSPVPARILVTVSFHPPLPPEPPKVAPPPPAADRGPHPAGARRAARPRRSLGPRLAHEEGSAPTTFPRTETRFVPGAFGDPFRIVRSPARDGPLGESGLPYYYVRGSPPETVGYSIDGIRVPPALPRGGGTVDDRLAPPLVDSVDLFPGAYPASFGRYAGAIIAGETTAPQGGDRARRVRRPRVRRARVRRNRRCPATSTVLAAAQYAPIRGF